MMLSCFLLPKKKFNCPTLGGWAVDDQRGSFLLIFLNYTPCCRCSSWWTWCWSPVYIRWHCGSSCSPAASWWFPCPWAAWWFCGNPESRQGNRDYSHPFPKLMAPQRSDSWLSAIQPPTFTGSFKPAFLDTRNHLLPPDNVPEQG